MEEFDVDAFLNDLRGAQPASSPLVLMTLLHHLWKDHPLKISQSINLVALSEDIALDLSDIRSIRKNGHEDYCITFKSNSDDLLYIYRDTPEYDSLLVLMHLFNKQPEH